LLPWNLLLIMYAVTGKLILLSSWADLIYSTCHDLQRAIYLILNGEYPYNSVIKMFKNYPCFKIFVIFVYASEVFMTTFAFVVY